MQLVEAGKLELDAPVQHYLPWFQVADSQAAAQMTVRHLLNQTSGLPTSAGEISLADFDDSPDATERQVRALSTLVLTRPAGSAFEYSNMNYNVLGLIIEVASGESYAEYVQKKIFTPLDMSHTYISQAMAKQNGLAVGHRIPWALRSQLLIPALQIGGVVATLRLLRRWRLDPKRRPSGGRAWGLLPLIPNLLVALTLIPMLGKRRG
jgi:CubicO group peptidase (beta-lactamase class C family)